jgi:hypothetical protein
MGTAVVQVTSRDRTWPNLRDYRQVRDCPSHETEHERDHEQNDRDPEDDFRALHCGARDAAIRGHCSPGRSWRQQMNFGNLLYWAVVFLVIAVVAALFGFGEWNTPARSRFRVVGGLPATELRVPSDLPAIPSDLVARRPAEPIDLHCTAKQIANELWQLWRYDRPARPRQNSLPAFCF